MGSSPRNALPNLGRRAYFTPMINGRSYLPVEPDARMGIRAMSTQLSSRTGLAVGGIILCGGQSKRMGRPKAWLPFAGETMLPRVVRLLGEVVQPIVVVA